MTIQDRVQSALNRCSLDYLETFYAVADPRSVAGKMALAAMAWQGQRLTWIESEALIASVTAADLSHV